MPGSTPNGVPYAEPTDPLVQWPATSQLLAEQVDILKVRTAQFLWTAVAEAWTDGAARFTFPANAPDWIPAGVVACPILGGDDLVPLWTCLVQQPSVTEVVVHLRCSDPAKTLNKPISLIAVWI